MTDIKERLSKLIGEPKWTVTFWEERCTTEWVKLTEFNRWHDFLIERLAKDAKVLPGQDTGCGHGWSFSEFKTAKDTHTCIALDFQPIERGVTKDEIVEALREATTFSHVKRQTRNPELKELLSRIEREGIKP